MEAKYIILWIDDDHEGLLSFRGQAKDKGIRLVPFKSLNGGMSELERNYTHYDGVLLDAKFLENEDDVSGTEGFRHIHRAKDRLRDLPKKFELFVLTGKDEALENDMFNASFLNVYKKGDSVQVNQLLNDLIESADKLPETQLRHQYRRVFDVCTERYIGEYAGIDLLKILMKSDDQSNEEDLNTLRKIIEDLLTAFHKFNLLPEAFVHPKLHLNPSSLFLAGKAQNERTEEDLKAYRHNSDTHLPKPIAYGLRTLLNNTQDGSHRAAIDGHIKLVNAPYLFKSLLFQLMDILVWFKIYVDSNPKTENWKVIDLPELPEDQWIEGQVINRNWEKGYAFLDPGDGVSNIFIPPHLVSLHQLEEGNNVKGVQEEYTDNRDNQLKTRIKKIEPLNP